MSDTLVDLRPHERRLERRARRDSFGRSAYRFCIVLLLLVIVLMLSEIYGMLGAIYDKLAYG